jgi:hypothetical protein
MHTFSRAGWLLYYFQLHNVECSNNNISREGGLDTKASAFMYRVYIYTSSIEFGSAKVSLQNNLLEPGG